MKVFPFILLFLSPIALACPQLAGIYKKCQAQYGDPDSSPVMANVEQKIVNKFHQFKFNMTDPNQEVHTETYLADGKARIITTTDPYTGIVMKTQTTAACEDQTLSVKMDATMNSEVLADLHLKISKENNQLVLLYEGQSMNGQIKDLVICQ